MKPTPVCEPVRQQTVGTGLAGGELGFHRVGLLKSKNSAHEKCWKRVILYSSNINLQGRNGQGDSLLGDALTVAGKAKKRKGILQRKSKMKRASNGKEQTHVHPIGATEGKDSPL